MIAPRSTAAAPELALAGEVLTLRGAMTLAHARRLEVAGGELLRGGAVTVDLAAATEIDSSALAVLFAWQRAQTKGGGSLVVRAAPAALLSLAKVYGVGDQLAWG